MLMNNCIADVDIRNTNWPPNTIMDVDICNTILH